MWLPTGGQLKTVTYVYPPRHKVKEIAKKRKKIYSDLFCSSYIFVLICIKCSEFSVAVFKPITEPYRSDKFVKEFKRNYQHYKFTVPVYALKQHENDLLHCLQQYM